MSIKEVVLKIKGFWVSEDDTKERIITIIIIFLVGTASFGLGRLSAFESKKEPVTIEMMTIDEDLNVLNNKDDSSSKDDFTLAKGGEVVASKTGDKYHFPWCSGAQRILEDNKIYFKSVEEARKAGYTPALNCKGLK